MEPEVPVGGVRVVWQMPPDLTEAVGLGGQMGRRFAEFDWEAHPLGPPSDWPVELRSMVAVALTSRFPIVLWLGRQDLYLVYNDAYIPVLGDKHPAALGRPGRQVWWDIWEPIGPMLSGVINSGEATWSDDLMLALVTEGWAQERYFTFSYSPIILASGQVYGVFCAVTETTERVLGERRLHVLNAVAGAVMETRTVGEAVDAMIGACGSDHPDLPFIAVYLAGGDERPSLRAAGPRVEGLVPQDISALEATNGDDETRGSHRIVELSQAAPALAAAYREHAPTRALLMPIGEAGPDQTSGRLMVGLNPRRRVDGQYRGFLRLLADQMSAALAAADSYRQQQRRADTLAELDRAKTAFLTNVSHEFRTPLTLLLGPLEDAIAAAGADVAQWERLTMARRNGQRLLRLVNSLLEFSRIEAGRAVLAPRPVDLGAVTAQVASSFAGLCERAGIALVLECESVTAGVDLEMWETIVLNLLSNAVKFTYHGSITVRVEPIASGGGRLSVVDTGTGIAAEDLGRLFERFYRASNAHGRSVEGSGIGLSLVRSLVELHDGTVGVESEPEGGTTVTVELPESRDPATTMAEPAGNPDNPYVAEAEQWLEKPMAAKASRDADRKLVLIADDNADMREHLNRILSQRWNTVVVRDGRAALDAVRRHRPDLVVTDVMMPLLDGFGFVQALRQDPNLAATPVLMLSARAGAEAAGDGFAAGADDYLAKPFTSTELLQRAEARLSVDARQKARLIQQQAKARHETAAADLATAITAAESIDAILDALLSGPATATGAAIGVPDPDGSHLVMHYAGDVKPELRARYHRIALDAPVPTAIVAATGEPMVISDTSELDPRFEQFVHDAALEIRSSVTHPLRDSGGTVIGAVALLWPEPQAFDEATLALFTQAATVTGHVLARITAAAWEHRIATGFQDHLLDLDRGSTAAVIAAVYQPAAETMRVGGDWYLATPLGPGSIAVCVGDVVGHGLPAATVMGKLRAAVAATALSAPEPAHVLSTVQRYAATVSGARCASLAYATIDTANGTIDYVCAGHPYPVVVTPDGRARLLDKGRMPSLAAFSSVRDRTPGHDDLPPGSLLILYTDGLVERRGQSLDEGFARLVAAAADCATLPVDTVCSTLLRRLAPSGGYTDDVVILALRPAAVTDTGFVTSLAAAATELAPLRHRLSRWLDQMSLDTNTFHDILIATGEAVVNAIEHGSGLDSAKTISLEAFATPSGITVSVTDTGQWRGDTAASRRSRQRGRGLTLMHGMADQVDTIRSPQGTTVTLHFRRAPAKVPATAGA